MNEQIEQQATIAVQGTYTPGVAGWPTFPAMMQTAREQGWADAS
jgi:hypothetical protein